ncbi:putative MFS monocarboxylate transporter [Diplogelasinospora grovesii]|uniref:MFS monocarboxylate transporter n=1 Tax=Diplogelasinospora grovesii TaxID=303347 RepID=A0AAN6N389_9PEZI|nr:putative MFS monocarboxylate transporter [Diplogelasinospora grovesii]
MPAHCEIETQVAGSGSTVNLLRAASEMREKQGDVPAEVGAIDAKTEATIVTPSSGDRDNEISDELVPPQLAADDDAVQKDSEKSARLSDIASTGSIAPSMTAANGDDGEEYPEGGVRAWLVVFGCWLALFASLGLMNILATFQTYVSTNQLVNYDDGTIGWVFSVYAFLSFFLGIYIGPLFDKYGPRWLVLAGTLCLVLSLMLLSISYEYWHFLLAFGVLSGLASSLLFTPSVAAVGHFFKARRGFATGVATTAGSVGGVIFPLMLQRLFVQVGWAWAIRTLAFLCLAVTVVANFLIRSRLPPAKNASAHPDMRIFVRNRAFALTTAAVFLLEFALFVPLTYISSYALSKGFSQAFAFDIITILNTGSVFGRVLSGFWADRIGPFNANIVSVFITIVACFGIWLPLGGTMPGIIVFALLFGFTSGSNISLVPVAIGRLCKTQHYGRYYATCYTIVSLATLVGIPIAGKVVAACRGEYWGLIVLTGLVYIASLAAFLAAKASVVGWRLWSIF